MGPSATPAYQSLPRAGAYRTWGFPRLPSEFVRFPVRESFPHQLPATRP
jgi:hypothetical protein